MTDLYLQYIEILKEKEQKGFPEGTGIHAHHIVPKHDGGALDGEVVRCTYRDHARAHFIRHKVYKKDYDLIAYYGLAYKTEQREKLTREKIVSINKERGNGPFNIEWQKEMANRPKSKYHLQENPEFAREIGALGGKAKKKTKKYQRHPLTCEKLSQILEWEHKSGVTVISPPMKTVVELKNYLNNYVPDSVKYAFKLSEIFRNLRKRCNGWRIVRVLDS